LPAPAAAERITAAYELNSHTDIVTHPPRPAAARPQRQERTVDPARAATRRYLGRVPGIWQDLELGAPEIARLGMNRINAARVALLGTLRPDASPRISPVEPYFVEGQLLVGAMTWSRKAADLLRDPRYVLHSAVTGPDADEGELKLYGSAVEAGQDLRSAAAEAWWTAFAPDKAMVFSLRIAQAAFIEWDTGHGLMTVHRWSPASGYSQISRGYP
jgi:hypothetical protein